MPEPSRSERSLGDMARAALDSLRGYCNHEWEYLEREPGETYTGYCERCVKCGEIVQIVQ